MCCVTKEVGTYLPNRSSHGTGRCSRLIHQANTDVNYFELLTKGDLPKRLFIVAALLALARIGGADNAITESTSHALTIVFQARLGKDLAEASTFPSMGLMRMPPRSTSHGRRESKSHNHLMKRCAVDRGCACLEHGCLASKNTAQYLQAYFWTH
eukprot:2467350-Amphidinium_carterae.2